MPVASADIVLLDPIPVIAPGFMVQAPDAGSPFKTTLPTSKAHVGWVTEVTGIAGVYSCALITALSMLVMISKRISPPTIIKIEKISIRGIISFSFLIYQSKFVLLYLFRVTLYILPSLCCLSSQ